MQWHAGPMVVYALSNHVASNHGDDSHSMQYRTLSASFSMKSKQTWPDMGCAAQHFCTHFRICAHTA